MNHGIKVTASEGLTASLIEGPEADGLGGQHLFIEVGFQGRTVEVQYILTLKDGMVVNSPLKFIGTNNRWNLTEWVQGICEWAGRVYTLDSIRSVEVAKVPLSIAERINIVASKGIKAKVCDASALSEAARREYPNYAQLRVEGGGGRLAQVIITWHSGMIKACVPSVLEDVVEFDIDVHLLHSPPVPPYDRTDVLWMETVNGIASIEVRLLN